MTTDIHIKNFQSIKDLHIKIDGFTVLIGKNNLGKSAIIRAIKAALDNQTGNKNHIRRGEKNIEVRVTRPDIDFMWSKGDEAFYEITEPGKSKEVFKKLNGAVPEPLTQKGYDKIPIDGKMENPLVAGQFKELFILDRRDSVITEILTDLYDIDVITIADEKCQKDLKANKSKLKGREADLKTLQADINKYKDIEIIKENLRLISEQDALNNILEAEIQTLQYFEEELNKLSSEVDSLKNIEGIKIPDISTFDSIIVEFRWLEEKDQELITCATSFKKLKGITKIKIPKIEDGVAEDLEWVLNKEQELNHLQSSVDQLKKIEGVISPALSGIEDLIAVVTLFKTWDDEACFLNSRLSIPIPEITDITDSIDKIEILVQNFSVFTKNEQDLRDMASSTKTVRDELKTVLTLYTDKKKELDAIEACPLCDRPFHA